MFPNTIELSCKWSANAGNFLYGGEADTDLRKKTHVLSIRETHLSRFGKIPKSTTTEVAKPSPEAA
jgi:hypothetical protein